MLGIHLQLVARLVLYAALVQACTLTRCAQAFLRVAADKCGPEVLDRLAELTSASV
jgi:hypothetical protein